MFKTQIISSIEISIKYFVPQTIGSIFILTSILINKNNFLFTLSFIIIFSIGVLIKLALIPFHIWLLNVIKKITLNLIILVITMQKLIPLIIIKFSNNYSILIAPFLSLTISRILGFYQNSIRKILSYSSILNTRWITIIFTINKTIWLHYFTLYSFITLLLIKYMKKENFDYISNIFIKSHQSIHLIFFLIVTIAGLPPSIGFILKLILIKILISRIL